MKPGMNIPAWPFSSKHPREAYEAAAKELGLVCLYGEPVKPGDLYLAGRNRPLSIFTCKYVDGEAGFVIATDPIAYPYDFGECVKVIERV